MQYQQNLEKTNLSFFVIFAEDNTYLTIKEFIPLIKRKLKSPLKKGITIIK
jgi:hypothetical protein